ncbi:MAG: hypothetical protein BRC25_02560 [Parcubacteria group bacterium SW_6_46_9]|nr:MAG: hypothetical protein BRC25_02560 [Parcubacteria group bacterium SW_6_46_9]
MNRQKISSILKEAGLSDNEITVYLDGLQLGPSGASQISEKCDLNRTLVYHVLDDLEAKGLVSKSGDEYGRTFQMEPPTRLKDLLARKKQDLMATTDKIETIIPAIENIKTDSQTPSTVRFYEGQDGIKSVADNLLNMDSDEFLALVPIANVFDVVGESYIEYWLTERESRSIKSRSIWQEPDSRIAIKKAFTNRRFAPDDMENFGTTMVIYDNKVAVFSAPEHLFAFVVESDDFSATMRAVFEQLWNQARHE